MAEATYANSAAGDNRLCAVCNTQFSRSPGEAAARWRGRLYCSLPCAYRGRGRRIIDRFTEKVDATPGHGPHGDCHLWTAATDKGGYGVFQLAGQPVGAHRMAWEIAHDCPVPSGLFVLHSCDNPPCVNPAHLSVGTPADNMADKIARGRTRVPFGSDHHQAAITAEQAVAIYHDPRSSEQIARDYPISGSMVLKIKRGKAWRHATGAP